MDYTPMTIPLESLIKEVCTSLFLRFIRLTVVHKPFALHMQSNVLVKTF